MKPVLNNTNLPLSTRVSIERYFSFLSENVGIFSVDGIYLGNNHLKVIEPKEDNGGEFDKVLIKLKEFLNALCKLEFIYELEPEKNNGIKGFSVQGVSTYEIECSKFNLGYGYISPYINNIEITLYSDDANKDINVNVPFILIDSTNDIKVMVLPFASKLASYNKVYDIQLYDMDSSFVSNVVKLLITNLTPGDIIFNRVLSSIPCDKYEFREDNEALSNAVRALGMDLRLVDVKYDENLNYPDMPITKIDENDPGTYTDIMCTDGFHYDKITKDLFLSDPKYKAIVIRYANPNGDVFIGKINLDERFTPLNSTIYERLEGIAVKDNKLVEETIFKPTAESYDYPIIHGVKRVGFNSLYGFKESDDELVNDSSMKDLYKVNSTMADKIKKFMDEANQFFRNMSKEKAKLDKGVFENNFFRGVADTLIGVATGGTLAIFLNPLLAIIGGVTTFLIRRMAKGYFEDREYKYVRKVYERELQFFQDKLEDYQDNPSVVSRIEMIIDKYQKDLDKLDTTYNRKTRDREATATSNEIGGY